jgi:hypothetical protein
LPLVVVEDPTGPPAVAFTRFDRLTTEASSGSVSPLIHSTGVVAVL